MSENKKKKIVTLMEQYVKDNVIDMSRFRQDNPKEYSLLSHYWGSINEAVEANNWIKINKQQGKKGKGLTLRNKLALQAINLKLDNGSTYEKIAKETGVTKAAVSQLHKALQANE